MRRQRDEPWLARIPLRGGGVRSVHEQRDLRVSPVFHLWILVLVRSLILCDCASNVLQICVMARSHVVFRLRLTLPLLQQEGLLEFPRRLFELFFLYRIRYAFRMQVLAHFLFAPCALRLV